MRYSKRNKDILNIYNTASDFFEKGNFEPIIKFLAEFV